MNQGVGELNVGITARTTKARKNVNAFRKDVRGIKKDSAEAAQGLSKLAKGGIALAAAAGITKLALKGIANSTELARTGDKLGIVTTALSGLQLAAQDTGVSVQTVNTGLQRMTRRISEAAIGTGEAQSALNELGLDAEKLNSLTADEQFKSIADAMAGVALQSDKVRLAAKLFDSEGVALINTLKLGSEGLERTEVAARRLGIAIDGDVAAKTTKASRSIDRLQSSLKGIANDFGSVFSPIIGGVADIATEAITFTREAVWTVGGLLDEQVSKSDLAAEAARRKAGADSLAAAKARDRAKKEADLTDEFKKQLAISRRQLEVARLGDDGESIVRDREDKEKFGRSRGERLQSLREQAVMAKQNVDQEKQLLAIKQRIADLDKTQLQKDREAFLRKANTSDLRERGNSLFDQLERAELAKEASEKRAREAERKEAEARRKAKQEREREKREAERNASIVLEDRIQRGNRDNASLLSARSAAGFTALRSSVNQTDRQAVMLKIAQEQKAEAAKSNELLETIAENSEKDFKVFSLN